MTRVNQKNLGQTNTEKDVEPKDKNINSDENVLDNKEDKKDETIKTVEKTKSKKSSLVIEGNLIISHKVINDRHLLMTENGLGYNLSEDEFAEYVK